VALALDLVKGWRPTNSSRLMAPAAQVVPDQLIEDEEEPWPTSPGWIEAAGEYRRPPSSSPSDGLQRQRGGLGGRRLHAFSAMCSRWVRTSLRRMERRRPRNRQRLTPGSADHLDPRPMVVLVPLHRDDRQRSALQGRVRVRGSLVMRLDRHTAARLELLGTRGDLPCPCARSRSASVEDAAADMRCAMRTTLMVSS